MKSFNNKNAFLTLAIGNFYTFRTRSLLQCVLTLTESDIVIVTDQVSDLLKYVSENYDNYNHRIHIIDITTVTEQGIKDGAGKFNYNLKGIITCWLIQNSSYKTITYVDSDVLLLGWDTNSYTKFIETAEPGLYARLRNTPAEEPHLHFVFEQKVFRLGKNITDFKARMPIECVMIFVIDDDTRLSKFVNIWKSMMDDVHRLGLDSFMEALELTYAMSYGDIIVHSITETYRENKFINCFRVLHHDKIIEVF